jgi:hypothetical protein
MTKLRNKKFVCCICGDTITGKYEFGNNPWPFQGGRCC